MTDNFTITGVKKIMVHHDSGATRFDSDIELMAAMRGIDRHTLANALGLFHLGRELEDDMEGVACFLQAAGADVVWVLRGAQYASLAYDFNQCPYCDSQIEMEPLDPINDTFQCTGLDQHQFHISDLPHGAELQIAGSQAAPHPMVILARLPAGDNGPAGISFYGETKGGDA
ncbi:MAG: hypothetical protein R6X32_05935 [Chloroflexota bacterium]